VGELLENQYRIGLVRMERAIKERMSLQEVDALMPHDLVNPKPVSAVVKEFFGTSQLSQFMDQTNPLSETTHKRRLSALGPGGLTRERAGFEVRDVHPSHYGRICPIETPEGPNIGLIVSLSTYARVNEYGFIETPYSVVSEGNVSKEVKFLSAFEEKDHPIAQANAPVDAKDQYINPLVTSRVAGEFMMVTRPKIELMDISPNQLVSVSASLIPFLENDDANRALMGSNMQRQAVPLMVSEAPLVGTGIEGVVAKDSGVTIVAKRDGVVVDVDASRIVLQHEPDPGRPRKPVTIYNLAKFIRSNQNTCFNHRPIVKKGQRVFAGESSPTALPPKRASWPLGKTSPWPSCPGAVTTLRTPSSSVSALCATGSIPRCTSKSSRWLPGIPSWARKRLPGTSPTSGKRPSRTWMKAALSAWVPRSVQGDALVGKITPKGETQLSPEEKLLRAIFGEKAGDVKDTSLRVPPGVRGSSSMPRSFPPRNRQGRPHPEIEDARLRCTGAKTVTTNCHYRDVARP
jgi:DNA-directed RNA polymerase subunit beta